MSPAHIKNNDNSFFLIFFLEVIVLSGLFLFRFL